ncbi:GNAT family N-acetyltransferase [Aliiglaciecola sp. LCG003]|uniref:GNAT family N-acetyltransferase n=1 Tax=Aliiglaciecola sp. LCG003 TaxID=3053655 RepID=UPI002573C07A|nr:GNAT family N-acetyltransferase [Aliiglaciecola sp. LCG003]WJG09336.1 GNAT family N-acetyltransferase [Aliiglaciecola sp. LCG003]
MPKHNVITSSPEDAKELSRLIFASGQETFEKVFNPANLDHATSRQKVLDYLFISLGQPEGQFGYSNQYIIKHDAKVIACGSCWTSSVSDTFKQSTLRSLIDYFGVLETAVILNNNTKLARLIMPPQSDELGVGHIAVAVQHRREGLATTLLEWFKQHAIESGKRALSLQVVDGNLAALRLYQKFGFERVKLVQPEADAIELGLQPHVHMRLELN